MTNLLKNLIFICTLLITLWGRAESQLNRYSVLCFGSVEISKMGTTQLLPLEKSQLDLTVLSPDMRTPDEYGPKYAQGTVQLVSKDSRLKNIVVGIAATLNRPYPDLNYAPTNLAIVATLKDVSAKRVKLLGIASGHVRESRREFFKNNFKGILFENVAHIWSTEYGESILNKEVPNDGTILGADIQCEYTDQIKYDN